MEGEEKKKAAVMPPKAEPAPAAASQEPAPAKPAARRRRSSKAAPAHKQKQTEAEPASAAEAAEAAAPAEMTPADQPQPEKAVPPPKPARRKRATPRKKPATPAKPEPPAPATLEPPTPEPPAPTKPEPPMPEKTPPEMPQAVQPVPEELAAEERRAAELTRTVQVSIEQILAHAAEQQPPAPADVPPVEATGLPPQELPEEEPEEEPTQPLAQRITEAATSGLSRLLKWTLLVLVFVVVIAGAGIYWLYRGATPDMLPRLTVTFDGQTVEPTAYRWEVPVVSNLLKRDYAETLSTKPTALAQTVESTTPKLTLTGSDGYETALVIADAAGTALYSGTLDDFKNFTFTQNGDYTGKLVVTSPESRFTGSTSVTGSQTYQFEFAVNIRPTVRINTQSVTQGGVVALRVSGLPEGETPTLACTLENTGFVKGSDGWVAYLPIPCEADTSSSYELTVKTQSYDQVISLTVRPRTTAYRDYTSKSGLTSPYLGLEDTPAAVDAVLEICDPQVYWMASGFVQPFIRSIAITLPFGTTEYVGRTTTQRANNSGTGRTSTNVVVTGHKGETLISPADGRVVLAEDLGGTAGNTVVVEHGAGLKSIFYDLSSLAVEEGDPIVQGQPLGTTGKVTIGEVRIGRVPVEPLSIWRGQCDAVKNF